MAIRKIKRQSVSDQVFEQLKEQLLMNEWRRGEKLPSENELATSFDVSRVTVRHALQKLTALGLIETKLGEGSFVRDVAPGISMNQFRWLILMRTHCKKLLSSVELWKEK